jgi:hypothetical protein
MILSVYFLAYSLSIPATAWLLSVV